MKKSDGHHVADLIKTVIFAAFLAAIVFFTVILISMRYNETYGHPKNEHAVMNLAEYRSTYRAINLYGEWEFFYNRWIVTDGDAAAPDGMIKLPGLWTGMRVEGKKLPRSGYASYRMRLVDFPEELPLRINLYGAPTVYRVFVNGEQVTINGVMQKETNRCRIDGYSTQTTYRIPKGASAELVVEVSGNSLGGLLDAPCVMTKAETNSYGRWIFSTPTMVIGVILALAAIGLVMCLALRTGRMDLSPFFFLLSLLLYYLTTKDGFFSIDIYLRPTPLISFIGNIVAAALVDISFLYYLIRTKLVDFKRGETAALAAILVVSATVQIVLLGTPARIIFLLTQAAAGLYTAFRLFGRIRLKVRLSVLHLIILAVIFLMQMYVAVDDLAVTVQGTETIPFIGILLMMFLVDAVYLVQTRANTRMAIRSMELSKEIAEVKQEALRAQIKPHFVFNSLTSIQDRYHVSTEAGDDALYRFSRHLRLNIDAESFGRVPFEEELKNILNYFELENLRQEGRLQLLFDIEDTDFEVPILSLQPLVENAVKYAGTENREDGYIQISAHREEGHILVEVADNGAGFDPQGIREGAKGLKNAAGRLKYELHAEVQVESAPDRGTKIRIIIPEKEREDESDRGG